MSFLELGELLSDNYHMLSIDLPGHGMTPAFANDEDYAIPNLIKWISDLISLIEKDSFYLMAHSWGGCIALHFSVQYPEKIKKMLLLDGGYHIKQFQYEYFTNDKEKLGLKPDCSLEEEIKSYEEDFDGYIFSNWNDFLNLEKKSYLRWSDLLEQAARDLMKEESDGVIRFRASGDTARGAIKSMYNYPTNLLYSKIDIPVLLLQATLPESWTEVRNLQVEEFKKITNSIVKRVPETTHQMHWDKPILIETYIRNWFK